MVTKSSKNTRSDKIYAKELRVDASESKYVGTEPLFETQPEPHDRSLKLMKALSWYGRFWSTKQAKIMLIEYLQWSDRDDDAKLMAKVSESEIIPTFGWLARLTGRGLELSNEEQIRLENEIHRLISIIQVEKEVINTKSTVNVQEIMRERAREAAGEVEGLLDEFLAAGTKLDVDGRVVSTLSERNILPQHISILVDVWQKKITEFTEVLESKDPQFKEAWGHYSKSQIRSVIKFCEAVVADLKSYGTIKKQSAKPRARKPQSPEKIVKNIKYLRQWEDSKTKLKLESVSPVKLHGASECYLYDVERRKLVYLVADELVKTMTVKGTTILGFDATRSQVKTIRKPEVQISELNKLGKPAGRKYFESITTVATQFSGRTNENMIILKAW